MSAQDDMFDFAEEDTTLQDSKDFWKILVVDDDAGVHSMSKAALHEMLICGKHIKIYDAYSAQEAVEVLKEHDDIVLAFIDVVMETTTAGLELVNSIRKDMNNEMIRLIIRTGQPGEAPEQSVIDNYDISDYKEKTELTIEKLYTTLRTSIRQYQQLQALHQKYEEFYNKMMHHPLTNFPNRMKLNETLDQPKKMNLVLINIQNFTSINQTFSFEKGDEILKFLANYLDNQYSGDMKVFHLEGDHFALLNYEQVDIEDLKRIRVDIQEKLLKTFKIEMQISIKIGAVFKENGNLIQKAEIALHDGREHINSDVEIFK